MTTKIDLINSAYSQNQVSGLTVSPSPELQRLALERLEDLMAEWSGTNICIGYNFEENPHPNSKHNVPRKYRLSVTSNLMVALLSDLNRDIPPALSAKADTSFTRMLTGTSDPQPIQHPSRMPRGSGNRRGYGYGRYSNFYYPVATAPDECATKEMVVDDSNNYYEDFTAYLNLSETLASFTTEEDDGVTISGDAISGSRINYTALAVTAGLQQMKIVATTSSGRIETRLVNFEITDIEIN